MAIISRKSWKRKEAGTGLFVHEQQHGTPNQQSRCNSSHIYILQVLGAKILVCVRNNGIQQLHLVLDWQSEVEALPCTDNTLQITWARSMEIVKRGTCRYTKKDKVSMSMACADEWQVPSLYANHTYAARSPTQHHSATNSSTQQGLYSVKCGTVTNTSAAAVNPTYFTFAACWAEYRDQTELDQVDVCHHRTSIIDQSIPADALTSLTINAEVTTSWLDPTLVRIRITR